MSTGGRRPEHGGQQHERIQLPPCDRWVVVVGALLRDAQDVNPLVNPYVRGTALPPEGAAYADRSLDAPGMIHDGDVVVEAFASHGWIWGGTWSSPRITSTSRPRAGEPG